VFVPLVLVFVYNLATSASPHKHHVAVLGLAIALVLAAFLTELVKNLVGRPRPDLLARCKPAEGTPRDVLVTIAACTETQSALLQDGWRSFPSGHSSFAFAGLGYLSLFLAAQASIFAHASGPGGGGEKLVRGDLGRALLCLIPLLVATWIAISRCQDYRHDVWDVGVGSLLGWTTAYWSYRRYWPRLSNPRCYDPYPDPPSGDEPSARYGRVRDEEEGSGSGQTVGFERHSPP
jgi:diacylglycerol diphosphate phosphatase/phosphatidate phosphatase